ncbi:MAG: FHA domain-containing protein [Lachnospiraceae bacterium]|nr:FHA domain-containing protein [Lachnospiraceae bacterium]
MEWIAMGLCFAFGIHMLILWIRHMRLDNHYNQNISIHGGWSVGKETPANDEDVLYVTSDETSTIYRGGQQPRTPITSSFSEIWICLYDPGRQSGYESSLRDQVVIGRYGKSGGVDIQIPDSMVSRKHCRIYRQGEQILLQDLGSSNRTYVNQCPVTGTVPLMYGDRIKIGARTYEFRFQL